MKKFDKSKLNKSAIGFAYAITQDLKDTNLEYIITISKNGIATELELSPNIKKPSEKDKKDRFIHAINVHDIFDTYFK